MMDKISIENYSFYRSIYSPVESNMFILIESNEAIVIDSNISENVRQLLKSHSIDKVHLFLTHEHYDHSNGVCWMKNNFNTLLYCHERSKGLLSTKKNCNPRLVAFVLSAKDNCDGGCRYERFKSEMTHYELYPDVYFLDGQTLEIANHKIRIIHVPGHSPASCLLVLDDKIVFTGDSLIEGNRIITSFRGGNKEDAVNLTLPRLKQLPDEWIVMPGHGNPFMKKDFNFDIYNV